MNNKGKSNRIRTNLHTRSKKNMPTPNDRTQRKENVGNNLSIEYKSLIELIRNPKNPRVHSKQQIEQIAASIEAFGFVVPVLIDSSGQIIAGHGRVEAAQQLRLSTIPVIELDNLTPAQITAFSIADNKLTENSEWNEVLLAQQLKFLTEVELDFSLDAIGFETAEIDLLIEGLEPANHGRVDSADELPQSSSPVSVSKEGDLWILGRHRIMCADALKDRNYSVLMEGQKAASAVTDPPYNVKIDGHVCGLGKIKHREFSMAAGEMTEPQFTYLLTRASSLMATNSANGSLHYLFIDWRHLWALLSAGRAAYSELKALCVWNKGTGGMGSLYRSQHELILVFKNGKASHRNNVLLGRFGRNRTNVWDYPGQNSFARKTNEGNLLEMHPTAKPVALIADALMDSTARGDMVLDPFLGSGTTLIASERVSRVCYGIEIDPLYVDLIVRRWQVFTGLSATHAASGRTFIDLEKEAEDGNGH
jgi:DNA modification methylase